LEFEQNYSVEMFRNGEAVVGLGLGSAAPSFAKSKTYIEECIETPFDYIIFDSDDLQNRLLANGIDTNIFWNIWRLTPAVYRFKVGHKFVGDWLVKRELKLEEGVTEEIASYVLENTIDIALRLAQRRRSIRQVEHASFYIRLKRDGVNLYKKADRCGPIELVVKSGLRQLDVDYSTVGLDGTGLYWHVAQIFKSDTPEAKPHWYLGYIHDDEIDWRVPTESALPLSVDEQEELED
jgi:hypothetical protein